MKDFIARPLDVVVYNIHSLDQSQRSVCERKLSRIELALITESCFRKKTFQCVMTFTMAEFTNIPSKLRSATNEKENNKNQSNNKNCHLPIYLRCHAENTQMCACIEYVYIYKYINGWIQDNKK